MLSYLILTTGLGIGVFLIGAAIYYWGYASGEKDGRRAGLLHGFADGYQQARQRFERKRDEKGRLLPKVA